MRPRGAEAGSWRSVRSAVPFERTSADEEAVSPAVERETRVTRGSPCTSTTGAGCGPPDVVLSSRSSPAGRPTAAIVGGGRNSAQSDSGWPTLALTMFLQQPLACVLGGCLCLGLAVFVLALWYSSKHERGRAVAAARPIKEKKKSRLELIDEVYRRTQGKANVSTSLRKVRRALTWGWDRVDETANFLAL